MNLAQVENGVVVNVIVADHADDFPEMHPIEGEFGIGDFWDGIQFSKPTPAPASPDEVEKRLSEEVQGMLDSGAKAKGYDNIVSACSYAAAPNPFQAEGQAFLAWRGEVWAYCYQVMDAVKTGSRPVPSAAELLAELPPLVLP